MTSQTTDQRGKTGVHMKKRLQPNIQPNRTTIPDEIIPVRYRYILIGGLLLSLIIKFFFLATMGNNDMNQYQAWGDKVLSSDLANAYSGVYFPLQWQFLAFCSWVGNTFHIFWVIPFKCMNLFFDVAGFGALVMLLHKYKLNPLYALFYCLHPWFILDFAHGFIDSQFTFFILLLLLLLHEKENTFKSYFMAGIPLACAFLMKPQVMLLFAAISIFAAWSIYKTGKWQSVAILIPSVLLFSAFDLYLAANRPQIYMPCLEMVIPDILTLPLTYILIGSVMPCLTASMYNMWYPVAYYIKPPDVPLYNVNFPVITNLTILLTLCGIIIFVIYLAKKYQYSLNSKCLFFIFVFVSLVVPFFMTSAHCTHPFLATVLLIILLGMLSNNKVFNFTFNGLLLLMFLVIFSRYGWGIDLPQNLLPNNGVISNSIAILATVSFFIILYFIIKTALFKVNQNDAAAANKSGMSA